MKESHVRDSLRRIQDIVADATGKRLDGEAEKQLEGVLARLAGAPAVASGETFLHREVTILLADLRGFTSITARHPARVVLDLLNRCFAKMSEIVVHHHGTIDKFMGDSMMVIFFGDPAAPGDDVRRALHCAVDMQIGMDWLNRAQKRANMPQLFMGIGINTGTVMAGMVGSELYSAYTVIGEDVNLTSRIEAFSLRGQVLITDASFQHCREYAAVGAPMQVYVKGRAERVVVRELLGIPALRKEVPRQEIRRSPRVDVSLPFSYQVVENKIVLPPKGRGAISDIGYQGILSEIADAAVSLHSELKLEFDLPLIGYTARDIYARVVKEVRKNGRSYLGMEFTSLNSDAEENIQLFVQMLIQGSEGAIV